MLLLLFTGGAAVVTIAPDADSADGNWTNELGNNTDLYASVDEAAADDNDYIISGVSPSTDICKLRLSDPSGTMSNPITVSVRYKKVGTETINLVARLVEGTTTIATGT